jgi:hypothetical protein
MIKAKDMIRNRIKRENNKLIKDTLNRLDHILRYHKDWYNISSLWLYIGDDLNYYYNNIHKYQSSYHQSVYFLHNSKKYYIAEINSMNFIDKFLMKKAEYSHNIGDDQMVDLIIPALRKLGYNVEYITYDEKDKCFCFHDLIKEDYKYANKIIFWRICW